MAHSRGYARYIVSNAVKQLTDAPNGGSVIPAGVYSFLIQNADPVNDLAWTDTGTIDPSTTEGMLLRAGESMSYDGDPSKFKMIRAGGADVNSVRVTFYGAS
jgi:hypothetical protein